MKSYDETANEVLCRIRAYETAQKRRRKRIVQITTPLCCACLALLIGLGVHHKAPEPTAVTSDTVLPVLSSYGEASPQVYAAPANGECVMSAPLAAALDEYGDTVLYDVAVDIYEDEDVVSIPRTISVVIDQDGNILTCSYSDGKYMDELLKSAGFDIENDSPEEIDEWLTSNYNIDLFPEYLEEMERIESWIKSFGVVSNDELIARMRDLGFTPLDSRMFNDEYTIAGCHIIVFIESTRMTIDQLQQLKPDENHGYYVYLRDEKET